jgi:hypothetical protein
LGEDLSNHLTKALQHFIVEDLFLKIAHHITDLKIKIIYFLLLLAFILIGAAYVGSGLSEDALARVVATRLDSFLFSSSLL